MDEKVCGCQCHASKGVEKTSKKKKKQGFKLSKENGHLLAIAIRLIIGPVFGKSTSSNSEICM